MTFIGNDYLQHIDNQLYSIAIEENLKYFCDRIKSRNKVMTMGVIPRLIQVP